MNSVVPISPDPFIWFCPQSQLEPLLLAAALLLGGDVRYDTELVSFTQDDAGVIDADSVSPDLFDQPLSEDNND